jgi:hypothetical protein
VNQFQIDGSRRSRSSNLRETVDVPSGAFRGERLPVTLDRLLPR